MTPDYSGRFNTFILSPAELQAARTVNPFFLAYLQNKIATYANAIIEDGYDGEKNQVDSQVLTMLRHEKLKAQVIVLEELFMECSAPEQTEPNEEDPGQQEMFDPRDPVDPTKPRSQASHS